MSEYRYYLGPWKWTEHAPGVFCWMPPASTVGSLDLGKHSDRLRPGVDRPLGFFATTAPLDSAYVYLGQGDCRDLAVDAQMRSAWRSATGYEPQGDRLVDLAWDQLTNGADPSGESSNGMIVPETSLRMTLHMGRHGLLKAERFTWGQHPYSNRLRDLLRADFAAWFAFAHEGKLKDKEHHRRVLDGMCVKYRLKGDGWRELIPPNLLPHVHGRLPHATSYSDNFPDSDQALSATGRWTASLKLEIFSNQVRITESGVFHFGRFDSDLSSSDNSATVDFVSGSGVIQCGSFARVSGSAQTGYAGMSRIDSATMNLFEVTAGTPTSIGSDTGNTSMPFACVTTCNGSTIGCEDGVASISVTDTAHSTGVRGGLAMLDVGTAPRLDNWGNQDLGGGGFVAFPKPRGMTAGMLALSGGMQ